MADMEIRELAHFYEVRQLLDAGGPLRNREAQLRFGLVERDNGDIVVLQITDHAEQPDALEMAVLEDRYSDYLSEKVAARSLV